MPEEIWAEVLRYLEENWGRGSERRISRSTLSRRTGSTIPPGAKLTRDGSACRQVPERLVAIMQMIREIDVRHLLSAIRVPTLVVYRTADIPHAAGSRYLGAHIPGAKVVELAGQ